MRIVLLSLFVAACSGGTDEPPAETDETDDTDLPAETDDTDDSDPPETDDTDPPDTDLPAETDDTDDTDPPAPIDPCDLTAATAQPATYDTLYDSATSGVYLDLIWDFYSTRQVVVQDQATYDQLQAGMGIELPAIDFSTHTVLAGWRASNATCGLNERWFRVWEIPGTTDVVFQYDVFDSSGNCPTVCEALGYTMKVVSVLKSNDAVMCVRHSNQCP